VAPALPGNREFLTGGEKNAKKRGMCGRFTLTAEMRAIAEAFVNSLGKLGTTELSTPRFNICPSQPVIVVLNDGKLQISHAQWGLIPAWANDASIGNKLANARAEGIESKPSFRTPFKRKRCLVLADGFYEWKDGKPKVPHYFRLKSKEVFAFAGLWDTWQGPDGKELVTCCIITTTPNALLAPVHDRMPVILQPKFYDVWLSEEARPAEELLPALVPYPAEEMEGYPVSTFVNKPDHDSAQCVQPLTSATA
jgi:putative SOS response-associated peptidase YedK